MTILIGLLCFILYTKPVQKISYENNVTFNKSLYIASPTTANIITAQGGSLSGSIEVENFLINTTYSPQTNITSFGSNNLENTTKIIFNNLPNASLAKNTLSSLGLNNSGQLCIYKENTPPDTLSQETINANIINGNSLDTLFIKNPDGTIIIGNKTGNVYFYSGVSIANTINSSADKITFYSDINTQNIITNTLKTNNLEIHSSNITFNTETTTINTVTNSGIVTCGLGINPILETTATITDGSLTINTFDEKTEANITILPIETTNNPSTKIIAIDSNNKIIQCKDNSAINLAIQEITLCDNFNITNIMETNTVNLAIKNDIRWKAQSPGQIFLNISPTENIIINGQTNMLGFQVKDNFIEKVTCIGNQIRSVIIGKEVIIQTLNINNHSEVGNFFINTRSKELYNMEDFPQHKFYYCTATERDLDIGYSGYNINASTIPATTKNKSMIEFNEPKIFSYKKTYSEDICPKSKEQKRRIAFISKNSYLDILENLSNYYKDIELKLEIAEKNHLAIIAALDRQIETIERDHNKSFFNAYNNIKKS